jgi:hypothetical protein
MGAKMMPMEKKRGSTVFGVRIGLMRGQRCAGGPLIVVDLLPCLQPLLSKRSVCWLTQSSATCPERCADHLNSPLLPQLPQQNVQQSVFPHSSIAFVG